jgi:hypothetical protein
VQRIIRAYDEHKTKLEEQQLELLDAKTIGNGSSGKNLPQATQEGIRDEAAE